MLELVVANLQRWTRSLKSKSLCCPPLHWFQLSLRLSVTRQKWSIAVVWLGSPEQLCGKFSCPVGNGSWRRGCSRLTWRCPGRAQAPATPSEAQDMGVQPHHHLAVVTGCWAQVRAAVEPPCWAQSASSVRRNYERIAVVKHDILR